MVASATLEAFNRHKANIPVWRARYLAQWPNLEPFPNDPSIGVWHMSDIPLAFRTYADVNFRKGTATKNEQLLSSRLMDAWLTFAEVKFVALLIFYLNTDPISEPQGWFFKASRLAFVRPQRQHLNKNRKAQLFIVLLQALDPV
jgi:hypothetical protein